MSDVGDFGYEEGLFCGLISTRSYRTNVNQFANLLDTVLEEGGAFIYLYNGKVEKQNLEILSKLFQMDLSEKEEEGHVILVNMEVEFKLKNKVNFVDRVAFYEDKINDLREKGIEKIVIYVTMDHLNIIHDNQEKLYEYYEKIKALCSEKRVMATVRYIVDDLFEEEFIKLISLHDSIIIDGDKVGNKYTYLELISTSLAYLSKKQQSDEKYRKEMKRIEYLKSLGELVEGFTHDFNNILTTIIGFSQIALIRDSENQVRDYLSVISKSAIDGKAMIDKVHDYVKGCFNGVKKLHKMNDIVISSTNMIKYKINQKTGKQIALVVDLKSERSLYCDEFELRQVFLNMLLNGMSAIGEKGTLTVRTYDKDEKVYLEIKDTGIGMSEEVKEKIFEPFFTTKGKLGTGLGLNTSRKILENYSAEINVDSEIGVGTVFTIVFPETIKEVSELKDEEDYYSAYGARVLVIDDKYSVAKVIAELISLVNMTAEVETNGENVLQRLEEEMYDVIICDYSMPNINGIQVSELVKAKYPKKPFILLTGYSDKINEKWDTVDYVLKKPCTVEELADVLGKSLNTIDVNKDKSYNIV